MILWLILFFLVIGISLVLAYQSMQDYYESPVFAKIEYSPFLVRLPQNFTVQLLDKLHTEIAKKDFILSIERLFKGGKTALVLYGPRDILLKFSNQLNLLELEDYTNIDKNSIQAWEAGPKNNQSFDISVNTDVFQNLPPLLTNEQFWWQITLRASSKQANKSKDNTQTRGQVFQGQIRSVFFTEDSGRRSKISAQLQDLLNGQLVKIPQPFTSGQIFDFYKQRTLAIGRGDLLILPSESWIVLSRVI
ncbi:hypothetical protein HYW42_04160 [Candidatus Daviesbacteria bacterium]|nr:hypothetical protein [Candidatus Daviesbacteria bacterium]